MNAKKMFLSLIPWVLFSLVINRHGANEAAIAALLAAGLAVLPDQEQPARPGEAHRCDGCHDVRATPPRRLQRRILGRQLDR